MRVRPSNLDDVRVLLGLVVKGSLQLLQTRQQHILDFNCCGDVHGGGVGVVAALAFVDMVIWVDRLFAAKLTAKNLYCSVGDDLIGVHVRLSSRTSLPDD